MVRDYLWSEQWLERNIKVKKGKEPKKQYYVYVLEASLAFQNGMTIPLMSEFLNYSQGDTERQKQAKTRLRTERIQTLGSKAKS
jgi:hypothetical protein